MDIVKREFDEVLTGEVERKVLVSPGFGAGWSTWSGDSREATRMLLFDEALIDAVEAGADVRAELEIWEDPRQGGRHAFPADHDGPLADFARRFTATFGDAEHLYLGGARDLEVQRHFGPLRVEEYDGSESVRTLADTDWF